MRWLNRMCILWLKWICKPCWSRHALAFIMVHISPSCLSMNTNFLLSSYYLFVDNFTCFFRAKWLIFPVANDLMLVILHHHLWNRVMFTSFNVMSTQLVYQILYALLLYLRAKNGMLFLQRKCTCFLKIGTAMTLLYTWTA